MSEILESLPYIFYNTIRIYATGDVKNLLSFDESILSAVDNQELSPSVLEKRKLTNNKIICCFCFV